MCDFHYRSKVWGKTFIYFTLIQQGYIQLIISDSKDNLNSYIRFLLHFKNAVLLKFLLIKVAQEHHIRMISEGSCDTKDWSNNAENPALHHSNKLHSKIHLK